MRTVTFTESAADYAELLDSVADDREEVVITRTGHEPVVLVALSEYTALKEAAYLLGEPENARCIIAAIGQLESGRGEVHGLVE
ncbi:type II toxin-antitoxin system Phd/YefM family antitoxin [Nocardiopsis sediminis]|uniref:Antitoxin n=1 Tax=Nocardiopsis sediminis TaxID=1778267 RepID=A0ABV8FLW8_9ACTN